MGEVDTFLTHYGVIGMRWGHRKDNDKISALGGSVSAKSKLALLNAKNRSDAMVKKSESNSKFFAKELTEKASKLSKDLTDEEYREAVWKIADDILKVSGKKPSSSTKLTKDQKARIASGEVSYYKDGKPVKVLGF